MIWNISARRRQSYSWDCGREQNDRRQQRRRKFKAVDGQEGFDGQREKRRKGFVILLGNVGHSCAAVDGNSTVDKKKSSQKLFRLSRYVRFSLV